MKNNEILVLATSDKTNGCEILYALNHLDTWYFDRAKAFKVSKILNERINCERK